MDMSTRMTGDEWESWANALLALHYDRTGYQPVPSDDDGDAGIEGYSFSGDAYQMYGPERQLTLDQEYEKLRKKMTNDINKFCHNQEKLLKILGDIKIRRWILFVPESRTKRIVQHSTQKTAYVKSMCLPYVTDDFQVMVLDESAFKPERDILLKIGSPGIECTPKDATDAQVNSYIEEDPDLIRAIDRKVKKIISITNDEERIKLRNKMIQQLIILQNTLDELRSSYPQAYEVYIKAKTQNEKKLEVESILNESSPWSLMKSSLMEIKETLKAYNAGFSEAMLDSVCYGTVAEWLARCPLDFAERASNE